VRHESDLLRTNPKRILWRIRYGRASIVLRAVARLRVIVRIAIGRLRVIIRIDAAGRWRNGLRQRTAAGSYARIASILVGALRMRGWNTSKHDETNQQPRKLPAGHGICLFMGVP